MISPGDKVKHYEILEILGKGGMGEVFLAQDKVLDRKVAIKFLPEEMQKVSTARMRLLREAKAAASLDHPFICKIFEAGEIEGTVFIVMEFIEGQTLREKLDQDVLSLKDSLEIALEVAEALEEAHEKGIVHRDLKHANIMLTPRGHVKVMDFGLAKHFLPQGEEEITKTLTKTPPTEQGAIVGTLAYMSPEQARGEDVDTRSDIFSLGIILYEMTTGRHPFSKKSPLETLTSILRDSTPAINIKPRMINPILSPILRKALAKEPENRFQSIAELIAGIRKLHREVAGGTGFLFRRLPLLAAGVLITALILMSVWWFGLRGRVSASAAALEPISVLVADFENKTGDQVFDETLENAVMIGLESAPFVDVYKRSTALNEAKNITEEKEEELDTEAAILVSTRIGIDTVISGSIESRGNGYDLSLWAIDPATSEKVVRKQKRIKSKTEILDDTIQLTAKMASELGGVSPTMLGETFTTSSLDAMKAYSHAQELNRLGKYDKAIEYYRLAIAEDQSFGRAYSGLALVFRNMGQHDEAEKYFQAAMEHLDRMSERERYRTLGGYFLRIRDIPKAIEQYSELVKRYPADHVGSSMLALAYFYARDMEKSVETALNSVKIYPNNIISQNNLVWYALAASNFELAELHAQKVLEINPEYQKVNVCLAIIGMAKSHPEQAAEIYQRLKEMSTWGASQASIGLADTALYEGRLKEAKEILEKGINADLTLENRDSSANKLIALGETLLLMGDKANAVEAAERALDASRQSQIKFSAAQIYIQAGQEEKARVLASELRDLTQSEYQAYARLIEGEIKMAQEDIPGAIALFQEAQSQLDTWLGHFALGKAYLKNESFPGAHSEFDICQKRRGEATSIFFDDIPSCRYLPLIYYYLGRAQEGLNSPQAGDSYRTFIDMKRNSEEEPLVRDARRRLDSL
ncbi:MAG: protein kinase [Candidatus Aminicenantes bacterium]|nr:MAG: protein kinase [Candidatus Aminicenantes bacterium]